MAATDKARPTETKTLNLWQRMVVARQEMGYIQKKKQGGLPFATVNHDEVTVAARAALDKANVMAIPTVEEHGSGPPIVIQDKGKEKIYKTSWAMCSVTFVNPDEPLEFCTVTMFGEGIDNQDKGPGKAISYAIKYCYLKALMAETGEKDADQQDVDTVPEKPKPEQGLPKPTHNELCVRMFEFWQGQGITTGEVLDYLEVEHGEDVTEVHLDEMIKLARAVRAGSKSAKEALQPPEAKD